MIKVLGAAAAVAFLSAALLFVQVQNFLAPLKSARAESDFASCEYAPTDALEKRIPRPEDWIDYGPILESGVEGEWDFNWGDFAPAVIVKKDGLYYAYYIGSDGYRSFDGGHRHRSIGVAVSADGIRYEKYSGNPIITHAPNNGEEEGANSVAVTLDAEGNFVMFYGGAVGPRDIINANGRLAISTDGFKFVDHGIVLHHLNPFVYGFGDELFPVAAFQYADNWNIYYQPNGALNERTLGAGWGSKPDRLLRSGAVLDGASGGLPVGSWGNINWLGEEKIVFFIQRQWWPDAYLEVRTAHPANPRKMSDPVVCYHIPNLQRGTAFLDQERNTWFLMYTDFSRFWKLKLAPAGDPDQTPPSSPADLVIVPVDHTSLQLSWKPAEDTDSGIAAYRIYRDGRFIGQTISLEFKDSALAERTEYQYEVKAVNFHGYEGEGASLSFRTPADLTAPVVQSAASDGNPAKLLVTFNEPLEKASAERVSNYRIHPEIHITKAVLLPGRRTVRLTTSPQVENQIYTLSVRDVRDASSNANQIPAGVAVMYAHTPLRGMAGHWNSRSYSAGRLYDLSGYGNHGKVFGLGQEDLGSDGGLFFNGIDSYIRIDDQPPLDQLTSRSFTFTARFRPEGMPTQLNPYAILVRVNAHPFYHFGMVYDHAGRVAAQVISQDETFTILRSEPLSAETWHHAAMVVDRINALLYLFIDGVPVAGAPVKMSGELMDLNQNHGENLPSGEYYIGSTKPNRGAGSFFNQYFKGYIDEVTIYSRALTGEEIACLVKGCP